mmetsp:Transcript_7390/g.20705  ORF Transcript_7390/g.20705 Transcript_7390/m.20705 type:complete len:508 (-) Transcript_7390:302-1825(-)
MEGVVAEWNERGFGFIQFSDGRRAYVHKSECGGQPLFQGQSVIASVVEDRLNPGKWSAQGVARIGEPDDPGVKVEGTVAEWNDKGFGFIQFSDGRRAYVHKSACADQQLTVGQAVSGAIVEDPRNPGKWAAQDVVPASDGRPQGVVAQWNEKGFGFIHLSDGRRAFVHNSECEGQSPLSVGETVSASIVADAQNPGKLAAQGVKRVQSMSMSMSTTATTTMSRSMGESGASSEEGVVVDWKEDGGYGFLSLDDGRRAYIHRSVFGSHVSLSTGMRLSVTTKQDPRNPGKWCVAEVKGSMGGEAAKKEPARTPTTRPRHTGTVTEWSERGFGFVMMQDGRRAFVHNSCCGGRHLAVGDVVSAEIVPDAQTPGKWAAENVRTEGLPGGVPAIGNAEQQWFAAEEEGFAEQQGFAAEQEGFVTEWNEASGYGFIELCDGRRAYIHRSVFGQSGGLSIGWQLRVTIEPDARNPGKWCVGRIVSMDSGLADTDTADFTWNGAMPDAKRQRTS